MSRGPPTPATGDIRPDRWEIFALIRVFPKRGLEPRTYHLQDSPSTLTMAVTSDFAIYSDHFVDHSGASGRKFVSQVVSRPRQSKFEHR